MGTTVYDVEKWNGKRHSRNRRNFVDALVNWGILKEINLYGKVKVMITFSMADAFTKRIDAARIELAPRLALLSVPSSLINNSSNLFCSEISKPLSFKAGVIILLKLFIALETSFI